MARSATGALAFQATLPISATGLRLTAQPLTSPKHRRYAAPPRRPRLQHIPSVCTASSAATVLKDEVIRVPSTIPSDRHHPVKVYLRAESLGGRRRRVLGGVDIAAPPARVWTVLTAYESIERYMPNIVSSSVEQREGELLLDQVGIISNKLGLRSRMLVRVNEYREERTISFTRVEGRDFSEFVGRYFVRDGPDGFARLDYELVAMPFPLFPMYLVERKVFKEIPKMLASIREEALLGRHIAHTEE